jgi:hypothetical protein
LLAVHAVRDVSADPADWRSVAPQEALAWFSAISTPWWIAGGWAIDLFLGRTTRPHGDLDVGIRRRDARDALKCLGSWDVYEAKDGRLTHLRAGTGPCTDVNSLWCRPAGGKHWMVELLLDESDQDHWVYRRDRQIRRSFADLLRRDDSGLTYLVPEVQLLYKSSRTRPKDDVDFFNAAPWLDSSARNWLRESLRRATPLHPWIALLE